MRPAARRLARRLPGPLQAAIRRVQGSARLRRSVRRVRWGSLRRLEPVSAGWGSERGTHVDRYYIDRFFGRHSDLISGRVLEVGDPRYTGQFGHGVTSIDIVDIDPRNDSASIVADLAEPDSLPSEAFDCAVVPQTLVYVSDPVAATANLWRSLRPGGALLITVPAIARLDRASLDIDRWHLTASGLEEVVRRGCPGGEYSVEAHGNPVVAVAFLHGIAVEELRRTELDSHHALFPIVATAVVRKAAS